MAKMGQMVKLVKMVVLFASTAKGLAQKSCGNFTKVSHTGLVDGDHLLKQVMTTSYDECCAACAATPTCAAFTFQKACANTQQYCPFTTVSIINVHAL